MNIKDKLIEIKDAVEKFAEFHDISKKRIRSLYYTSL